MARILFFARSYLASLAPRLDPHLRSVDLIPYYLTQTIGEQKKLKSSNLGIVLPAYQSVITSAFKGHNQSFNLYSLTSCSAEINDIKDVTGFPKDPVAADRFLKYLDQDKAYRIASIIFSYSKYLLESHEFEAVIGEPVTMFSTHCLMYWSKKLNIKPLFWCSGFIPNTMYFTSSLDLNPNPAHHLKTSQLASMNDVNDALQYIRLVKSKAVGPVYNKDYYKKDKADNPLLYLLRSRSGKRPLIYERSLHYVFYSLLRVSRSVISLLFFRASYNYTKALSFHENLQSLKMSIKSFNDSGYDTEKLQYAFTSCERALPLFLFYPLQYEPEASLDYLAPIIDSQESFLHQLLQTIDEKTILIIKEHPNQLGCLLMPKWSFLRQSQQVICLPGTLNSRDIMQRVAGVVSISSSAGFEAAAMGIPTFLFSNSYYSHLPSVLRLSAPCQLTRKLVEDHIESIKRIVDIDFLTACSLFDISMNITQGDPQPSDTLFDQRNLANIALSLKSQIECVRK